VQFVKVEFEIVKTGLVSSLLSQTELVFPWIALMTEFFMSKAAQFVHSTPESESCSLSPSKLSLAFEPWTAGEDTLRMLLSFSDTLELTSLMRLPFFQSLLLIEATVTELRVMDELLSASKRLTPEAVMFVKEVLLRLN
jgi:hypothetical protein